MSVVTLYTKADCHLCEQARAVIEEVRAELPFELAVRDITLDERLHRAYFERIPVVLAGPYEYGDPDALPVADLHPPAGVIAGALVRTGTED